MEESPDSSSAKTIICGRCGRKLTAYLLGPKTGRRLCFTCYQKAKRTGTGKKAGASEREGQEPGLKVLRRHAAGLSSFPLAHRIKLDLECAIRALSELVGEGKAERQGILCRHVPAERESAEQK